MSDKRQLIKLRAKKLGVLICDARLASEKTIQECADAIGVTSDIFHSYENGTLSPSLPEVESLAYFLNVPLEHFWGKQSLKEIPSVVNLEKNEHLRMIRNRIIGTRLRLGRTQTDMTQKALSGKTSIDADHIREYESGEKSIPFPELETLAESLDIRLEDFLDQHGPIGEWRRKTQMTTKFLELSKEVQEFVCTPINQPYIELAMKLSELPAEKLRTVAESLLEITY